MMGALALRAGVGLVPTPAAYANFLRSAPAAEAVLGEAASVASRGLVLLALIGLGGAWVFTPLFLSSPKLAAARARTGLARRRLKGAG